ncbi:Hypothetical protein NTJ_15202 [Nesidiocoris tenuis]|uniref:Uncharacterized protein n=1 Tax=Nesidiocoris tenuis TaxID=355587 RepID=A0ABN7BDN9_9HEMI|nr:Hypothetical protein NTJ_15202 [Nesidiocoris tenuis]
MVDWARISQAIIDFFKSHALLVGATSVTGALTYGPEGSLYGAAGAEVSTMFESSWFGTLLSALTPLVPGLVRWLRSPRNVSDNELVSEGLTFYEFIRQIATMVANALRRLGLVPNQSNPNLEYGPRHHYPSPGF